MKNCEQFFWSRAPLDVINPFTGQTVPGPHFDNITISDWYDGLVDLIKNIYNHCGYRLEECRAVIKVSPEVYTILESSSRFRILKRKECLATGYCVINPVCSFLIQKVAFTKDRNVIQLWHAEGDMFIEEKVADIVIKRMGILD